MGQKRVHDDLPIDEPNGKKAKLLDPYEQFWDVIQCFKESWRNVFNMVDFECEIRKLDQNQGIEKFKSLFTIDEIQELSAILHWLHLLHGGELPGACLKDATQSLIDTKAYLGINYCVEILTPEWIINPKVNPISITSLAEMIDVDIIEGQPENAYGKIKHKVMRFIDEELGWEKSFIVDLKISDDVIDKLSPLADWLDFETKLRLILLSSIAANILSKTNEEGLTAKPNEFPSTIPQNLITIIQPIDEFLIKSRSLSLTKTNSFSSPQMKTIPGSIVRVNLPGMPNWMPNGGNSCYISSTLWPLYFLLNHEVQNKIQALETAEHTNPHQKINDARKVFKGLYQAITSQENTKITTDHVNLFRSSIQSAYPGSFVAPKNHAHEDAYDILICMIKDMLQLDPFSNGAPEFVKRHNYTKINDNELVEPEFYDYSDGSSYCKEALHTLDISFGVKANEPQTLNQLVTGEHRTEDIEKHAEKKDDQHDGPKSRTFKAQHAEQFVVESEQQAPQYFIGRLKRFSSSTAQGAGKHKRFDVVVPNATLQFHIKGRENEEIRVPYDLVAITNHSSHSLHQGHYYTYARTLVGDQWHFVKYCDINGPSEMSNEAVIQDAAINGYIFYYKKREANGLAPHPVPFEDDPSKVKVRKNNSSRNATTTSTSTSTSTITSPATKFLPLSLTSNDGALTLTSISPWIPITVTTQVNDSSIPDNIAQLYQRLPVSVSLDDQWINENQLWNVFQINNKQVYSNLKALFISRYPESRDVINLIDETVDDKEFFRNASDFLALPIYIIAPFSDDGLVVESRKSAKPSPSFIYGEGITTNSILYVFQQLEGGYRIIDKVV